MLATVLLVVMEVLVVQAELDMLDWALQTLAVLEVKVVVEETVG